MVIQQEESMAEEKPKVYVATPCYGMMQVETCVSLIDMFSALGGSGVECKFKSVRTSLVTGSDYENVGPEEGYRLYSL